MSNKCAAGEVVHWFEIETPRQFKNVGYTKMKKGIVSSLRTSFAHYEVTTPSHSYPQLEKLPQSP